MMSESGGSNAAGTANATRRSADPEESGSPALESDAKTQSSWVKFEANVDETVATIQPSSIEQIDVNRRESADGGESRDKEETHKKTRPPQTEIQMERQPAQMRPSPPHSPPMGSVNIGQMIRSRGRDLDEKFVNGDVICTVLPTNKSCAWVTRAKFHPNYVPEEIMDNNLTITVEDYVLALQILTNDLRFTLYNVLYKRVLLVWMALGFVVLLGLLFSGARGLALFGGGMFWLLVNASGIFVCMWFKFKLYHLLERCVAHVNNILMKHNILMGLDDRGKLSCHKVHLIFCYFETAPCIRYISQMLEDQERADANNQIIENPIIRDRMNLHEEDDGIVITRGSVTERLTKRERLAEKLLLRYSQRWVKEFVRKRLDLSAPVHPDGFSEPDPPVPPRHCSMARCPCQFIEEHLRYKPLSQCSWTELCC